MFDVLTVVVLQLREGTLIELMKQISYDFERIIIHHNQSAQSAFLLLLRMETTDQHQTSNIKHQTFLAKWQAKTPCTRLPLCSK
jgi:hypothetical protein